MILAAGNAQHGDRSKHPACERSHGNLLFLK
jgi:hypothetical protein